MQPHLTNANQIVLDYEYICNRTAKFQKILFITRVNDQNSRYFRCPVWKTISC